MIKLPLAAFFICNQMHNFYIPFNFIFKLIHWYCIKCASGKQQYWYNRTHTQLLNF